MPAGVHPDGDWTVAQPDGGPIDEIPFPTDPKPYVYRQRYQQYRENFLPLALDVAGPFGGVHVGESKFHNEGAGIISFEREFALVPDLRNEQESFVYPYQIWATGASGGIEEFPRTVQSRLQFDYLQTTNPELSIELPRAPKIIDVFNTLVPQNGFPLDGFTEDQEILAEDAVYKRWKGNIYERRQRFIKVPSIYSFIFGG